ncbi:MAG TPA: maleylacetoacetate isomerase [Candidatus Eisenbacteria bacterium]|nr:maleylacetoacetate isomerase [Candidatus Eisenbacteria bacterium]
MKLYTFFRSSASYRVRIALNLKGLEYEQVPVHLRRGGGEQHKAGYKKVNPQALVPALEINGRTLIQSLAIIEYLDERYPDPPLLPGDPADRALVRSMALMVACEVHPLQNLRVLNHLKASHHQSEEDANRWARHWIDLGLAALEQLISSAAKSDFCFGARPTLADICLVPQLANARRFGCDLSRFPMLLRIEERCAALPAFERARPENQPDAE